MSYRGRLEEDDYIALLWAAEGPGEDPMEGAQDPDREGKQEEEGQEVKYCQRDVDNLRA